MKKTRRSVRLTPAPASMARGGGGGPAPAAASGASKGKAQLVEMIGRMAAEDPARARAFLRILRAAAKTRDRHIVSRVLSAFGMMGNPFAEAVRPTPLNVRPASLAESWNAVGRVIGSSMVEFGERHDHHVG